jgi:uncharacterized protein
MRSEVLFKTIASALSNPANNVVEFVWHGGEPTLLPISFYQKILFIQSKFKRKDQIIINRLQTNGTRLNSQWIKFIKDNDFVLGLSIDGPPVIHNTQRIFADGSGSFDKVVTSIQMLQKEKIPFLILMVVDEKTMEIGAKSIFEFFVKLKICNYGVLASTPLNNLNAIPNIDHYISPNRFTNFLIELYECWRDYGDSTIKIRELDDLIRIIHNKLLPQSCTLHGECFGKYYVIEPDGQIAHCELFQGDSNYTLGNILNMDFNEIQFSSGQLLKLIEDNKRSINNMKSCIEFEICKGWCPHERYLSGRHNSTHKNHCCGLLDLITHIRNNPPTPNPLSNRLNSR